WKLLPRHQRSVDCQPARGNAVTLSLAERAEIAGAEKDEHLVLVLRGIEREMHAKAGVSEPFQRLRVEVVLSVIEKTGVEAYVAHARWTHLVQLHRMVVIKALVEEHQLERQVRVAPPCPVRLETDVAILVVCQLLQFLRQVDVGFLVRRCSELAGTQRDVVEAERRARRGQQECDERETADTEWRDVAPQKQRR